MKLQFHRTLPLHIENPPHYLLFTAKKTTDFTSRTKLQFRRTLPLDIENPPHCLIKLPTFIILLSPDLHVHL